MVNGRTALQSGPGSIPDVGTGDCLFVLHQARKVLLLLLLDILFGCFSDGTPISYHSWNAREYLSLFFMRVIFDKLLQRAVQSLIPIVSLLL